jgi:hypothetical protein
MKSMKMQARLAGFLYLSVAFTSAIGIINIPSQFIVNGNAIGTATNILKSEALFRLGMVVYLLCQILYAFLVVILYRLLKGTDKNLSLLMLIFVVAAIPIAFLNILNQFAALILLKGADYLNVFDPDQLQSLGLLSLNLFEYGIYVVEIFWGLWLLPLGLLVIRSGLIPKILGILLIIACIGYLADSLIFILLPENEEIVSSYVTMPSAIGEISIIFWLIIKGVR